VRGHGEEHAQDQAEGHGVDHELEGVQEPGGEVTAREGVPELAEPDPRGLLVAETWLAVRGVPEEPVERVVGEDGEDQHRRSEERQRHE